MRARVLGPGDERRLEAFLAGHVDSSMLLRRNVRVAGIVDRGEIDRGVSSGLLRLPLSRQESIDDEFVWRYSHYRIAEQRGRGIHENDSGHRR